MTKTKLFCLISGILALLALGAVPINFKDIASTNVVKTNDLALIDADLGGGSYATRTTVYKLILDKLSKAQATNALAMSGDPLQYTGQDGNGHALPSGGSTNLTDSGTNVLAKGAVKAERVVATNGIYFGATTNMIWVNSLATGGNGTEASPWVGVELSSLKNQFTLYRWPSGVYAISNTVDLMPTGGPGHTNMYGQVFHVGEGGTIIKYFGSKVAMRAQNTNGWTTGFGLENFRIDCSNAVATTKIPSSVTGSGMGTATPIATVSSVGHGLTSGDIIVVSGASIGAYNGVKTVTVLDPDNYTYPLMPFTNVGTSPSNASVTTAVIALQYVGVCKHYTKNVRLANAHLGLDARACVIGVFDNLSMSKYNEPSQDWATIIPELGVKLDARIGTTDATTTQTFNGLSIEQVGDADGAGLELDRADSCVFNGGTCELGAGYGIILNNADMNCFISVDLEANGGPYDLVVYGQRNSFVNCLFQGAVLNNGLLLTTFKACLFYGGLTNTASANSTSIENCKFRTTVGLTDNGVLTHIWANHNEDGSKLPDKVVNLSPFTITNSVPGEVPLTINHVASQTADFLDIRAGGTNYWQVNVFGGLRGFTGSIANPTYSFLSSTNLGFYPFGTSAISLAADNFERFRFSQTRFMILNNAAEIDLGASQDLILCRDSANVLQLGVDSDTAVAQTLKAYDGNGNNKGGAPLILEGGQSTGTGISGTVEIATALTGEESGSTANPYTKRAHFQPKYVALADSSATELIAFSLPANKVIGGEIIATTYATNNTPHLQCRTTVLTFQAVAVGTAITATIDVVKAGTLSADSGTMTETFSIADNGNNTFSIKDTCASDLTLPTERCKVVVTTLNGNAPVTITDP